jgi:hypothetical protein
MKDTNSFLYKIEIHSMYLFRNMNLIWLNINSIPIQQIFNAQWLEELKVILPKLASMNHHH